MNVDEKNQGKKPGNPWTKSLLIWVAVLFGLVLFVRAFDSGSATQREPLAYSESAASDYACEPLAHA